MIRREVDSELINKIANHPSVRPFVAPGDHDLDFAEAFPAARSGAVILTNGEDAAMVFEMTGDERTWQVCTMFEDSCRGAKAIEVGKEMRDFMIPQWADLIFGQVPNDYPHAKRFYLALGGEVVPTVVTEDGPIQAVKAGRDFYLPEPGKEMFQLRAVH